MTKLGPHILPPGSAAARTLFDAGARIVKMVDTFDPSYVRPGVTVIGRRVSTYPADPTRVITAENLRQAHGPEEAAGIWVDVQKPTYAANSFIKIWEGPNEPAFTDDVQAMAWYGAFEAERVRLLAALGLRAAVGCFSYGTPDVRPGHLDGWLAFLPALRAAAANAGILALHEYNDGPLTSAQVDPDGTGWLTFRYRKVIRDVLMPNGLGALPIVLTEFGRFNFRQRLTDPAYAADLLAADAEMQKDASLLGATIFTCGSNNAAWDPFNLDNSQVPQLLAGAWKAQPDPTPTPTPTGDTSMAISPANFTFDSIYTWDQTLPQPNPLYGNTVSLPVGLTFDCWDDKVPQSKVNFKELKPGSPNFGQLRTNDSPFLKPEGVVKGQADVPDIRFPGNATKVLKLFKGYGPIRFRLGLALQLTKGAKYRLTWPLFPNELVSDTNGVKVYSDDPSAAWVRLKVQDGETAAKIDAADVLIGADWYSGLDLPFGMWGQPQIQIVAVQDVETVFLDYCSVFGLKDSDLMIAPPIIELIANPDGTSTVPTTTPTPTPATAGTLKAALAQLVADATAAGKIADDVAAVQAIIG